jgi:hypothetical protein
MANGRRLQNFWLGLIDFFKSAINFSSSDFFRFFFNVWIGAFVADEEDPAEAWSQR